MSEKVKRIIASVIFCFIVTNIVVSYCYLMRERDYESSHITGIAQIDNVDVVFLGTSVTECAWQPYIAWKRYGMTSYDFASSGSMVGGGSGDDGIYTKISEPQIVCYRFAILRKRRG